MKQALMWGLSVAAIAYAGSAIADPPHLKGSYGFTGSGSCVFSSLGFDSTPQAISGGTVFSNSEDVEGIRTFNGDGTGMVKASGTHVTFAVPGSSFLPSAGTETWSFNFTYMVYADGSWTSDMVSGTFTGKILSGPKAGLTYTINQLPTITGLLARDDRTLSAALIPPPVTEALPPPQVETLTYSDGSQEQRICTRSRVLIELRSDDGPGK